ncbi:hypothetical protein KV395_16080 [Microbacterium luteolum]|uniref:DUF3558 domain-containing protein n=1 Tax=Microbacterium luteolum TaxID=69367 RepID=A0ABY7XR70_MICLT|nr:hypothetical protein [Microbacterium luteolum]WDM44668.1 hypothetical protein KV395_16080 [Microbacterium luteolum]
MRTMTKPLPFFVVIATALVLAGCSPAPSTGGESAPPTAESSATPTPSAEPTPEPTDTSVGLPTPESISCDTMLDPLVDRVLRSTQLIPAAKPWTQFGFEPTGAAIECPWGYEGQPHAVTYFAWAALGEGEGETFLALTAENGYGTTETEQGTWVTDPGSTPGELSGILVTDGWVAFAPTAELIPAILWTR